MYSLKFKDEGFDVVPAFGGVDAIEKLRGGIMPDVMVLDITPPVMDSIDLLRIIRTENLAPGAKVIILSNEDRSITDENSRALGVSGYVKKSIATPAQIVQGAIKILTTAETSA